MQSQPAARMHALPVPEATVPGLVPGEQVLAQFQHVRLTSHRVQLDQGGRDGEYVSLPLEEVVSCGVFTRWTSALLVATGILLAACLASFVVRNPAVGYRLAAVTAIALLGYVVTAHPTLQIAARGGHRIAVALGDGTREAAIGFLREVERARLYASARR